MAMNWPYFTLEFSGKPEGDSEAHILRTTDWTHINNFAMGQRVQRFPLTIAGEARIWYQSIHPFQGD